MNSSDFKLESMGMQEALAIKDQYPYVLIYCYSDVKLCLTSELSNSDLDECREARFFGPDAELHILAEEDRAVCVSETGQTAVLDKEFQLSNRFSGRWRQVRVRQYLEADEDGQMRIVLTRLVDVK